MHFHAVHDFLHAVPAAGHYEGTGVYRYHMRAAEARREAAPYFAIPILDRLPFLYLGDEAARQNASPARQSLHSDSDRLNPI